MRFLDKRKNVMYSVEEYKLVKPSEWQFLKDGELDMRCYFIEQKADAKEYCELFSQN